MSSSPLHPRLLKGAIVAMDLSPSNQDTSSQTTIPFMYNPGTVSRMLKPQQANQRDYESRKITALRFGGAPEETFTMEVFLDASDALEKGDATARSLGIYPQLFALEVLIYPPSEKVVDYAKLVKQGKMEVASGYAAPLTVLVWGPQRVVPVQLTSIRVQEEYFDPNLNPIRAKVTLELRALSYSDLHPDHKAYSLFLAYQKGKERKARQGAAGEDTNELLGVNVKGRLG